MKQCLHGGAGVSAKRELAEEVLRTFGRLRFAATGWSMLPTILPGDTLVVERISPDAFSVGDIALVGRDGKLCAHRVVSLPRTENRFWLTKGDAMLRPDRPVFDSELLGRVTEYVRAGKSILVSKKLTMTGRVLAQIVMRSEFAARFFVSLSSRVRTQKESRLACQE